MIGKFLRGSGRRHGLCLFFAFCASASLSMVTLAMAKAGPPSQYFNDGLRWVGTAQTCTAPAGWTAERLFHSSNLSPDLAGLCLYAWNLAEHGAPPTAADISSLFTVSRAQEMTQDVAVLFPSAEFSTQEESLSAGLRNALRAQVGDVSLLPNFPAHPGVRVVVIDSAPDAPPGHIQPGVSRHGDTLAHLIEDIVCRPIDPRGNRACAAEVTTELALPWIAKGVPGQKGGNLGTLADLARAIERAVSTWQNDKLNAPSSTPPRLLLNLSLGWEHTASIADCTADAPALMGPPARAVRQILQYAASQGALIIAAAGNDSGGPTPRKGLVCPGRYQSVKQDAAPSQALLVAVSGVDYQDHPLETARPLGITGIAGLGFGGVAWAPGDPVPPQLTGSSVSTAVVSAVSALVWVYQPSWTPGQVTKAVYDGGTDVGSALISECPLLLGQCRSHRASVCGALNAASASVSCAPAPPQAWSCPNLSSETDALALTYTSVTPTASPPPPTVLPRFSLPTVQVDPSVFPMPISDTCPTCVAAQGAYNQLFIPPLAQGLTSAVLVVRLYGDPTPHTLGLGNLVSSSAVFPLPPSWGPIQSAYITGFDQLHSVTTQIVVQQ